MTHEEAIKSGFLVDKSQEFIDEQKKKWAEEYPDIHGDGCPYCTGPDDMCNM